MTNGSIQTGAKGRKYDIAIRTGSLSGAGAWVKAAGENAGRVAVISNLKISRLYGGTVVDSLRSAGYDATVFLIGDGERFKSMRTLERVLAFLSENKFSRSDAVVALGGGVVGDLAGFAASVYLRGISFYQLPTTLLSMIDSSVGGKTGVNTVYGKNLVGSFYQPSGVLIDPAVLLTLPRREITAGLCEAVKHAALAGGPTFSMTQTFLEAFEVQKFHSRFDDDDFLKTLSRLIEAQISFKAKIVSGDEHEETGRIDARSRKILNFGHTLAHALEKATNYRYFRHGEAVGYGILFAADLSKKLELLTADKVELLNDVVHRCGPLPPIARLDPLKLIEAFNYDKKIVDRALQFVLLRDIGKPVIVSQTEIPQTVLKAAVRSVVGR